MDEITFEEKKRIVLENCLRHHISLHINWWVIEKQEEVLNYCFGIDRCCDIFHPFAGRKPLHRLRADL